MTNPTLRNWAWLLAACAALATPAAFGQERICPDGKRSYFGVCPDEGNNSRPIQNNEPVQTPSRVPAPTVQPTAPPPPPAPTPRPPVVASPGTSMPAPGVGLRDIGGNHKIALQWISWDYFGSINFSPTRTAGVYQISGGQQSRENKDYLRVEGTVVQTSPTKLWFDGSIVTYVASNSVTPCVRKGVFNFVASPGKKYWRLQEMLSPCPSPPPYQMVYPTDYVDIFF